MRYIITFCSVALLAVAAALVLSYANKKNAEINKTEKSSNFFQVRLPKIFSVICFIFTLFSLALFIGCSFSDRISFVENMPESETIIFSVISALMALTGLLLTVFSTLWKIDIFKDKDYFIHTSFVNKKHTVKYSECKHFKYNDKIQTLIITTDSNRIYVDEYCIHYEDLIDMLIEHNVLMLTD